MTKAEHEIYGMLNAFIVFIFRPAIFLQRGSVINIIIRETRWQSARRLDIVRIKTVPTNAIKREWFTPHELNYPRLGIELLSLI